MTEPAAELGCGQAPPLLIARGVSKYFPVTGWLARTRGNIKALDDVSFEVRDGEMLGVVGESGCGKSTLGKTLMGLYRATAGTIEFAGQNITELHPAQYRRVRGDLQYVYQDPGASLDPRWKIKHSLAEPLIIHRPQMSRRERRRAVDAALRSVGLPPGHLDLYPHEISGGQQRRVGLARILTLQPRMVILDEPTSGLDVSVQATVLKLILELQRTFQLTYLFISHDLSVVRTVCHRTVVMYLGTIVEIGDTQDIFDRPKHPYTRSLLAAIPAPGSKRITDDFWLEGEPPNPLELPSGCRFRARCPLAATVCENQEPKLRPINDGRSVACHFA